MRIWVVLAILFWGGFLPAAANAEDLAPDGAEIYRGKKVLWINSYQEGDPWADGISQGIRQTLSGSGVEFKAWHMNTLQNRSETYGQQAGNAARKVIEEYNPDVVIASDDNAQRFLVVPYLIGSNLPVIFCGVNRDPLEYGYPAANVTGMHEVDFVADLVKQMRSFAGGDRIGLIACQRKTDQIIADDYNRHFFGERLNVYLVNTFDEFKEAFLRAQQEVDILCLTNNAGIEGWQNEAAEIFMTEHIRIPTGGLNSWMTPYVIFNLSKIPEEQGAYAATTALRILAGERPGDIPVVQNHEARLTVNLKMAQAAGIVVPVSLLQTAEIIGLEALQPINQTLESKGKAK